MDADMVRRVSQALQDANRSYAADEFNLYAYWQHLARAAVTALVAAPPDGEGGR